MLQRDVLIISVGADALRSAKYWSEWQDLNLRPPRPERGALPDCATLRCRWWSLYSPRLRGPQARRQRRQGTEISTRIVLGLRPLRCYLAREPAPHGIFPEGFRSHGQRNPAARRVCGRPAPRGCPGRRG